MTKKIILIILIPVKALYSMVVMAALLVGCAGGETSYDGTYKMVLKQGEKEMTLTLEPVSYTHLTLPTNREV